MGKGEYFGEQTLINDNVRTTTAKAVTDVVLLSLDRENLHTILGNNLQLVLYKNSIKIAFARSQTLKWLN